MIIAHSLVNVSHNQRGKGVLLEQNNNLFLFVLAKH